LIPLHVPYVGEEELVEIKKVIDSRWLTQGPKVTEFEKSVCNYIGADYAVACTSCTTALHLALVACGIGKDDEVLVADYTYPATGHAVIYCGAKPIFVDVDKKTYNINPEDIKRKITSRTKAIIPVHTFGQCADIDAIKKVIPDDVYIIEDAACAMGSKYKNRFAGTLGHIACFSYHATKGVGIGEGGMITTNDSLLAERARHFSIFGISSSYNRNNSNKFTIPTFLDIGFNYKLSDVLAAMGVVQMRKLTMILEKKKELALLYDELLKNIPYIEAPYVEDFNTPNWQGYTCLLDPKLFRDELIERMKHSGIQTQIGTYSSSIQPVYNCKNYCYNSIGIYNTSIRLPMYFELTKDMIKQVCNSLMKNINIMLTPKYGDI